jgi:hypothetical protein
MVKAPRTGLAPGLSPALTLTAIAEATTSVSHVAHLNDFIELNAECPPEKLSNYTGQLLTKTDFLSTINYSLFQSTDESVSVPRSGGQWATGKVLSGLDAVIFSVSLRVAADSAFFPPRSWPRFQP